MSNKRFARTYVFSTIGVLGMLVLLVALNVISNVFSVRADWTEEDLYTLTPGTRRILKEMDTPVEIRFYYSKDSTEMPVYLKTYARHVADLLKEYRAVAGDNLVVRKLNPTPDSDAEDSANMDGVQGQAVGALGTGESIYFGLAIKCIEETVAIPFLSPEREDLLEYDITRGIYRVLHPEKPVVGVISSLPVMGQQQPNPMMPMAGQQEPPWLIISELERDFEVRDLGTDVTDFADDIDVLLLIHPTNLSDDTLYALDQFVLGGGRLLAFLDPMSMVESQNNPMQGFQRMPPSPSTLGVLLDAWGIEFDTEKLVADMLYMTRVQNRQGQPQSMPTVLSLDKSALAQDDPATAQLDSILFAFGGAFTGSAAAGLERTVLVESSEDSQGVEKFMAQMPGEQIVKEFVAEHRNQPLAVRLTGTFKTAFPAGKPGSSDADSESDADTDTDSDAAAAGETPDAGATHLTESAKPGAVVLVGDSDMLYDHFCVRKTRLFGQEIHSPMNDNLVFAQNLVEQLSGDSNLISIRSRGTIARPFEVVREMQLQAEKEYKDQIKTLEDEVARVQRKINELQREKSKDQRFIISPEQQEAIAKLREEEAKTKSKLKEVRKKFRKDIDSLEFRLKTANIALMPFVVVLCGLVVAIVKRRRMARK